MLVHYGLGLSKVSPLASHLDSPGSLQMDGLKRCSAGRRSIHDEDHKGATHLPISSLLLRVRSLTRSVSSSQGPGS